MALIHDIQADLLRGNADLAPILLKLRFLAAKLGSHPLAEWVKYETEGYPTNIELPAYRLIDINYTGTFSGPFRSGIRNAPIPSYLIDKFAGPDWTTYKLRQSVAAIDKLVSADKDGAGTLTLNASNLILVLQGKVYENYACNEVRGTMSVAQLKEVQHVVRNRILELVIEIEESVQGATLIDVGNSAMDENNKKSDAVTQIFYQTVHGNMSNVANSGHIENLNVNIPLRDQPAIINYMIEHGIDEEDSKSFARILSTETPASKAEPFGPKAKEWLSKNIPKALNGSWKAGLDVATEVLKKAALSYYGLSGS